MPKKPAVSELDQSLKSDLGVRIRIACANAGKKPVDIAVVAGVSLAHQYRIEAGERTPDALYLIKVAQHLGISLDALCGLTASDADASSGLSNTISQSNRGGKAVQIHGSNNKVINK